MPTKGSMVLYTCHFDADASESPNICPAVVTKILANGNLDLFVMFQNGSFTKLDCPHGSPGVRETWHLII